MKPRSRTILIILVSAALVLAGIGVGAFFLSQATPSSPIVELAETIVEQVHHNEEKPLQTFIEIVDSCGPNHEGACVNARSEATSTSLARGKLRTGMVLPVSSTPIMDETGRSWYKVVYSEWIRYPERMSGDWYVAGDFVETHTKHASEEYDPQTASSTNKRILVDRSDQKLYAYEGDTLVMEFMVSTGLDLTPTPRGTFTVFRKTPSRYMQGPLPGISDQYYDLPGVPWNLYFTNEGGAIHGAYWHGNFGQQWSHGCVNLPLDAAQEVYEWAPLGTQVVVRD